MNSSRDRSIFLLHLGAYFAPHMTVPLYITMIANFGENLSNDQCNIVLERLTKLSNSSWNSLVLMMPLEEVLLILPDTDFVTKFCILIDGIPEGRNKGLNIDQDYKDHLKKVLRNFVPMNHTFRSP